VQLMQQPQGRAISRFVFAEQEVVGCLTQACQGFFGRVRVVQAHMRIAEEAQQVAQIAEVIVTSYQQ
jgi:hypothetical protein